MSEDSHHLSSGNREPNDSLYAPASLTHCLEYRTAQDPTAQDPAQERKPKDAMTYTVAAGFVVLLGALFVHEVYRLFTHAEHHYHSGKRNAIPREIGQPSPVDRYTR